MYFDNFGEQSPFPAANANECPNGAFIAADPLHNRQGYCWPTYQQWQAAQRQADIDAGLIAPPSTSPAAATAVIGTGGGVVTAALPPGKYPTSDCPSGYSVITAPGAAAVCWEPPTEAAAQAVQVGGTSIPWWAIVIGAVLLLR